MYLPIFITYTNVILILNILIIYEINWKPVGWYNGYTYLTSLKINQSVR